MITRTNTISNSDFIIEKVTYPAGLHMPPHRDKLSCISLVLNGSVFESLKDRNTNAVRGSVLIKPKNAMHQNTFGNIPVSLLSIRFNNDSIFEEYFKQWKHLNNPVIYNHAFRLWSELRSVKKDKALTNSILKFTQAASFENENDLNAAYWIEQLKECLLRNSNQSVSIDMLAKKFSLHRVYMGRAFKKKYGVSPVEYKKHVRVASVFTEILTTHKSLTEIALDAGFADQSHMSRDFRAITNCTPGTVQRIINY